MKLTGWKISHFNVITDFLKSMYSKKIGSQFVLKGGTSLMICYDLNRFSEDIDLDSFDLKYSQLFSDFVTKFCLEHGYTYRVAKNTDTVKRYMINYNGIKPLKVEISYRNKFNNIGRETVNGIETYNISRMAILKSDAYKARDKIRDLYDICYISSKYWTKLSNEAKSAIDDSVKYKGIDHFDYIIKTQNDELIDTDKLETEYLKLLKRLNMV